ncbi:[LSU ribosomal protein L3P]-glutamine N5-methyltransferase [Colwellia chukchiensis]|uniref:Ribosomal protein uL3 glutamine methyltransferase n=1 Tax=Colwellia chukchiensis TaxID=641665 RepID=A0A1H7H6U0_9GAMM|nr:50S ribosomal protein L3 N(5)-glutamine methyltransferase [Colwellia chukchiensis]SEK45012.1 [LSU ribosomal protein L3P]-glutamine N5-methyltransferase [Colwellia chukchiensis]
MNENKPEQSAAIIDFSEVSEQLHTVADYVRFGASQFNQAELYFGHGISDAWHEALTLVMHQLALPQTMVAELMQCRLTSSERLAILHLFQRRINEGIPAAYLTNQAMFCGLPFYVDERVLVPRSPIGELIDKRFDGLITNTPKRILDLCTGSGCIAIACAVAFPDAEVDAVDLSIDALNVAQINIEGHDLSAQVIPIQSDVFSGVAGQRYDLIVTNPPYVDQEDVDALPQEYLHEPEMGLGSGVDGLDIVRQILAQAADHLNDDGVLICEVGNSQVHLSAAFANVPFQWLTFEYGGHGVFRLTKAQLVKHQQDFMQ